MHTWLKTRTARWAERLIHGSAVVTLAVVLVAPILAQSAPGSQEVSANDLARRMVTNELKFQNEGNDHWMYRQEKEESGKKQVKQIVETKDGNLSRLLSINERPLTAKEQQKENQRIAEVVGNPNEQEKLQRARIAETERGKRLFKMLPDAFVFTYAGREGERIKLSFRPNPNFQPPSFEARVFHDMEGELWVDGKAERLAAMNGRLLKDVKFAGGLLGRLSKGGHFEMRQAEVAAGHWEMVVLTVDMRGKALFFKTINVQQSESRSDFQPVPHDLTLTQAADILNAQIVGVQNARGHAPAADSARTTF